MNCGRVKGENLHRHTNGYCVGNQTICWVRKGKNSLLRRKNIIIRFIFVLYICVSNQAWGQEGWILALLWNTVTKDAKKRNEPIVSHLDPDKLGWMVGCFYDKRIFFSWVTKRMIPSGQDRPISTSHIANQNTGFASSCRLEVFAASVLNSGSL